MSGEERFDLSQGRSRPGGDHQFAWLMGDEPAVPGDVEDLALGPATVERLGVAADDLQRGLARRGVPHPVG